jgi:CMP/dCMP kinase
MRLLDKMIITISGTPGSGKSTVAKKLAILLNAERLYAGGALRELAREKEMTLEVLIDFAKTHPEIDTEVDEKVSSKAKKIESQGKVVIAEGRTQFLFIPKSIKIFVKVDPLEGAKRIWKDLQNKQVSLERNEDAVTSLEETKEKVMKRESEDRQRYLNVYKTDYLDESNYDFIIDTTKITAQVATNKVHEFIMSKRSNN